MKISLIALAACCAVSSSAFALQDIPESPPPRLILNDIPESPPPRLALTDIPESPPPRLALTDIPESPPPRAQFQRAAVSTLSA